eukprot:1138813-Pelagomonas_calceolata.AAC.3
MEAQCARVILVDDDQALVLLLARVAEARLFQMPRHWNEHVLMRGRMWTNKAAIPLQSSLDFKSVYFPRMGNKRELML